MSMDKWEALLKQWENITLTPDTLMAPAFDDNPDQSDVPLPIIRVAGVEGWGFIDIPKELQGLAQFVEVLEEVVRLHRNVGALAEKLEGKAVRAQANRIYPAVVGYRETEKSITRILEGKE